MEKKINYSFKIQIKGGAATPGAPIAPIFGSKGLSQHMMNFCKEFNERTKDKIGKILTVCVHVYEDKSIDFDVKSEPAAIAILKAAKIDKGSGIPNQKKVGKISDADLTKIAEEKMNDLNAYTIEEAKNIIAGTARSIGVDIV